MARRRGFGSDVAEHRRQRETYKARANDRLLKAVDAIRRGACADGLKQLLYAGKAVAAAEANEFASGDFPPGPRDRVGQLGLRLLNLRDAFAKRCVRDRKYR